MKTIAKVHTSWKGKMTGWPYTVKVEVDGTRIGELGASETIEFMVSPWPHTIRTFGGGIKRKREVYVNGGEELWVITQFSNLGILGGRLRFHPARASYPVWDGMRCVRLVAAPSSHQGLPITLE